MSNRFHNKWHRKNHHTYGNASNPDASHDPIASQHQPFLGEFVLQGALCAVAPMSAFAGYFYSNFTGLCAFAGYRAIQAKAFSFPGGDSIGLQVDSQNIAISAYAPWVGLNVYSMTHAISAYGKGRGAFIGSDIKGAEIEGGSIGAEIYSDNKAISANGFLMGAEIYSNRRAISAYGSYTAAELYGAVRAISAMSPNLGIEVYSNQRAISAYGSNVGIEVRSPLVALSASADNLAGTFYANNRALSAYGTIVAGELRSPNTGALIYGGTRGLSAYSGYTAAELYGASRALSAMSPQLGIEVYSNNRAISAYGTSIGLETASPQVALSAYSPKIAIRAYAPTYTQNSDGVRALDVRGFSFFDGDVTISGNLTAAGALTYLDTKVQITSSLYVKNEGTDTACTVIQTGEVAVAHFYDDSNSALFINGTSTAPGFVGINTATPNQRLTVVGNISGYSNQVSFGASRASGTWSLSEGTSRATGNLSHAEGSATLASGTASHTEGEVTTASGYTSHAEGYSTTASGIASHAEGNVTVASGDYGSHAEGTNTTASGTASHAEGSNTLASGIASHAEGIRAVASGEASHAAGFRTLASGQYATTIGFGTSATTQYSFAGGANSIVKDRYNGFAFGNNNRVTHDSAVALGGDANLASGPRAHSFGSSGSIASGYESYTEGTRTGTGNRVPFESYNPVTKTFTFSPANSALFFGQFYGNLQVTLRGCITGGGLGSFHEGDFFDIQVQPNSEAAVTPFNTLSALAVYPLSGGEITWSIGSGKGWIQNGSGWESHAEGYESVASGFRSSHAEGFRTLASGNNGSHAEGNQTVASGQYGSHAEGNQTVASGTSSHAEGISTSSTGIASHSEGQNTLASGNFGSHAEGINSIASGTASHAEGSTTNASGEVSHAEGAETIASGNFSHAAGYRATASQPHSYIWSGDNTLGTNVTTSLDRQYLIYAPSGVFIPRGMVGIGTGTDYVNTSYPLTVNGLISSKGLRLSDSLVVDGASTTINSTTITLGDANTDTVTINSGPVNFPNAITAADALTLGPGGDTNLYRSAADTLRTDDSLVVNGNITAPNQTYVDGTSVITGSLGDTRYGQMIDVFRTTDLSRQSTVVLADDDVLVIPSGSLTINKTYSIEAVLYFTSAVTTNGARIAFNDASAATTNVAYTVLYGTQAGTASVAGYTSLAAASNTTTIASGTTPITFTVRGSFRTGASVGNLALQWAQGTSIASNTTLKAGSYILLRRLD